MLSGVLSRHNSGDAGAFMAYDSWKIGGKVAAKNMTKAEGSARAKKSAAASAMVRSAKAKAKAKAKKKDN